MIHILLMCSSKKKKKTPPQKGLEIPGGGDSQRPKNLSKCMNLDWNFQRGGRGGNSFFGGGMDNFWNHTIPNKQTIN